jgi:hypothetical protein
MRRPVAAAALLLVGLLGAVGTPAGACFGTHLRIAVPPEPRGALAAYAAGYFIQEKTGIEPEFLELAETAVAEGKADLALVAPGARCPRGATPRPAGDVPSLGTAQFWVHNEVLDDLRFSTVDRALAKMPAFYASAAYRQALQSGAPPKKAARKAVLDGT